MCLIKNEKLRQILIILLLFISCKDYNSQKYYNNEEIAIEDIIHEAIDFYKLVSMNNLDTSNLKLYLLSELGVKDMSQIYKPELKGNIVAINENKLTEDEILNNQKQDDIKLKKYEDEINLFSAFLNKKINNRIMEIDISFPNLEIELADSIELRKLNKNELGYLGFSRIVFNRTFTKGYLSYGFYCGEGCAWDNNIEITKIKDVWMITKYYSGGIA